MARTIKRVAHDLLPMSDAVTELSGLIFELMDSLRQHNNFSDPAIEQHFSDCVAAAEKLTGAAQLIQKYIQEIDQEADEAGITKD